MLAGPEIEGSSARAEHPHEEATVLFLIMWNPIFLFAARGKNTAADGVTDDDVPITANANVTDRIVDRFLIEQRNRHKRRGDVAPDTFVEGREDVLLEIRRYFQVALGFELLADFLQHRAEIPQGSPGLGIGVQAKHWCADVSAVLLFREQAVGSSPIVDQPFDLFLPEWSQVLDGFGVASF